MKCKSRNVYISNQIDSLSQFRYVHIFSNSTDPSVCTNDAYATLSSLHTKGSLQEIQLQSCEAYATLKM